MESTRFLSRLVIGISVAMLLSAFFVSLAWMHSQEKTRFGGRAGSKATHKSPANFIVAASNSTAAAKDEADYVCTGMGDQATINALITALPAAGGKILLRVGTYNISGSIVIDRSYVDLEGETHPHWGGYNHGWRSTRSPAGNIGNNSSEIEASRAGFNLIQFKNTNLPDGGESRHRGNRIAKLYLVGNGYSSTGIEGATGIRGYALMDVVMLEDDFIQRVHTGVNVKFDAAWLKNLDIQDISGDGIVYDGYNGTITGCLVYDIGGNGMTIRAFGTTLTGNQVGNCQYGVYLDGSQSPVVTGNTFVGTLTHMIATNGGNAPVITGNSFFSMSGGEPLSTSVAGITIGLSAGTTGAAVTGNTFKTAGPTTGCAITFSAASTGGVATGNAISGAWNGGSSTTIQWTRGAATVATNAGDNAVAIAARVPTGSKLKQ